MTHAHTHTHTHAHTIASGVQDEEKPLLEGNLLSLGLGLCTVVYALAINHKFHQLFRNGVRMRSMLMNVMFQKAISIAMSSGENCWIVLGSGKGVVVCFISSDH